MHERDQHGIDGGLAGLRVAHRIQAVQDAVRYGRGEKCGLDFNIGAGPLTNGGQLAIGGQSSLRDIRACT
jgi:hypothetical protein